jgi:hypothetical protein
LLLSRFFLRGCFRLSSEQGGVKDPGNKAWERKRQNHSQHSATLSTKLYEIDPNLNSFHTNLLIMSVGEDEEEENLRADTIIVIFSTYNGF